MKVDLSRLWSREAAGYVAYYFDVATGEGNVYRITSQPCGKTRKLWTLHVNGVAAAFTSRGQSLRLADCKARAQEIENGAQWRAES